MARRRAADIAFLSYDFGAANQVEDSSGWEYVTPGNEMTRKVFLRPIEESQTATDVAHFTVVFEPSSATIKEAYAMMAASGAKIGRMPVVQSAPKPEDRLDTSLRLFDVGVSYEDEHGEVHPLATWSGVAADQQDAEAKAADAHWDDRLTAASCAQVFTTAEIPRFLQSDGWGHIFAGDAEQITRWVLDRATGGLIAAEVKGHMGWKSLSPDEKNDLAESIKDNDVLASPEDFEGDVVESGVLPEWAVQTVNDSKPSKPRKSRP